jgi:hypothetical protein
MATLTIHRAIIFSTAIAMIGCGGNGPVTTGTDAQNPASAAAPEADRQLLAAEDGATVENLISQLPERISEADAKNLLVQITPEQVAELQDGSYSVLARGGRGGHGSFSRGGHNRGSFNRGSHGHGSFSRGHFRGHGRNFISRFGFFGLGSYYFPYSYASGYYYPYFANSYYPYLYNTGGIYNPFSYYNPLFAYRNPYLTGSMWGGGYGWPGMMGGQQPTQPTAPQASPTPTESPMPMPPA